MGSRAEVEKRAKVQGNSHRLYVLLSLEWGSISLLNQAYDRVSRAVICVPAWVDWG